MKLTLNGHSDNGSLLPPSGCVDTFNVFLGMYSSFSATVLSGEVLQKADKITRMCMMQLGTIHSFIPTMWQKNIVKV